MNMSLSHILELPDVRPLVDRHFAPYAYANAVRNDDSVLAFRIETRSGAKLPFSNATALANAIARHAPGSFNYAILAIDDFHVLAPEVLEAGGSTHMACLLVAPAAEDVFKILDCLLVSQQDLVMFLRVRPQ